MPAADGNREWLLVSRRQFVGRLHQRLRYRWLGDPQIVRRAIGDLFRGRTRGRDRLTADLVEFHRIRGRSDEASLRRFLGRHPVIADRFRGRKTIRIPASVDEHAQSNVHVWSVPTIETDTQLADWLSLASPSVLDWLVLPHRRRSTSVDHYVRRSVRKRDGTLRWIENPKPVLKRVQRSIHRELLDRIPLHESAHAYRKGRGIESAVEMHVGKAVVLRIDLQNFFGSIGTARIRMLFRIAGYTRPVATLLSELCTAPASTDVDADAAMRHSRLPQGAPTSPTLANAIAFRLDRRLFGLCRSLDVNYSRYADDLIFSGDASFASRTERFATSVAAIAMDEGFDVNFRKTRTMRCGNRQQVLGLVLNHQVNTPRKEYEILKAILTNCIRHGPGTQNRESHLQFRQSIRGRVSYIAHHSPHRGEKLMRLLEQIDW